MSIKKEQSKENLISIIRISSLNRLIWPVIMFALSLFLLYKIPFSDVLNSQTIDNLGTIPSQNIDTVKKYTTSSKEWLYSGYNNYSENKIVSYIFYNITDDTCYFMFVEPEKVNTDKMRIKKETIDFTLNVRTDSFNSFLTNYALDINWNFDSLNEATAPVLLHSVTYDTILYKLILTLLLALGLYCLLNILYYITIAIFPLLSPQFSKKHRHSTDIITSRYEFISFLQTEIDSFLFKADSLYITKHYVLNLSKDEINIIPVNKLCFMFEHGNLFKMLWYMKVTHTLYFLCSNSLKCHFKHKHSGNIDYIINMLKEMIPDIMIGYSSEHQTKYIEIVKAYKNGGC